MGLDMWFQPDVARILGATYEAMQATAAAGAGGDEFECYREGFQAALRAVAAGFGLPDPAVLAQAPLQRRPGAMLTVAEPVVEYRLNRNSPEAPRWRDPPTDDRQWTGHVVDGEVLNTRRAYP